MDKYNSIEFHEYKFYLECRNCNIPPQIILIDNENIIISCNKCGLYENETIDNICSYSTEWTTNVIKINCSKLHTYKDFKSDSKNIKYIYDVIHSFLFEKEKIEKKASRKFCKTCHIFLCEECLGNHQKKKAHEIIELNNLKLNYCYKHNQKCTNFCDKCEKKICDNCLEEHNKHNKERIETLIYKKQNVNSFLKFIEISEDMKNNKYMELSKNIIWMQNFDKNQKESKIYLDNILSEMIQIFYKDLKISINLINFAKILFFTSCLIIDNDELIKQYNSILEMIKNYFSMKKLEEFIELMLEKKNKYIAICNKLSIKEAKKLKNDINKMFQSKKEYKSDFEKTKDFIKDNMEYSSMIKRYVTKEKILHPEKYLNIDNTIGVLDNFTKDLNENNDYVLSLLGKSVENNGIEINISKKKDENFEKIELASIQSIFTLSAHKKYELHFNFGNEENEKIINEPNKQKEFLEKYKIKISEELKVKPENIILTDVHHGSLGVNLFIVNNGKKGPKM